VKQDGKTTSFSVLLFHFAFFAPMDFGFGTRGQVHRPIHGEKPWEDSSPQGINCKCLVDHGTCPSVPIIFGSHFLVDQNEFFEHHHKRDVLFLLGRSDR
jgi:hypothetical protein